MKIGIVLLIILFSTGASAGIKVVGFSIKSQDDVKKAAEIIGHNILGLSENATPEEFREALEKRNQGAVGLPADATQEEIKEAIKKRQQALSHIQSEGFRMSSQDDVKKATEIIGLRTLGLPDNPTPEEFREALDKRQEHRKNVQRMKRQGFATVQKNPGEEILNENLPPAYINRLKNGGNCSYVDESGPVYIKTNRCGGICIGEIDCDNIRAGSFRVIHTAVCASEGEDCPSAKKCLATKRPKTIVEGGRIETLKARRELLKKDTDERVNRLKKTINESSGQGGALQ